MGGRGSAFISYKNYESSSGVDEQIMAKIMATMDEDKDTELEHNGYTKKLIDKNIHIKQSTDKISEEIIVPNAEKINQLTNKYSYTEKALHKKDEELRVRAAEMPANTEAMFVSNAIDFTNLQLVYNGDIKYSTKERMERNTQEQINMGYWVKSDKEQLINHTVTHEFGHYVQRVLMEKDQKTKAGQAQYERLIEELKSTNKEKRKTIVRKYSEDYAIKYFNSIQRIARKEYGRDYENQPLSNYAKENTRETFAELFCSLNTNSNPDNDLVKAMEIYLKRRL